MNDDVAASRTLPQEQQKRGSTSSTSSDPAEGHFHGFRGMLLLVPSTKIQVSTLKSVQNANNLAEGQKKPHPGIFSKEGKIGKHFPKQEGSENQGESKVGVSKKGIDRSEMYGGYGV